MALGFGGAAAPDPEASRNPPIAAATAAPAMIVSANLGRPPSWRRPLRTHRSRRRVWLRRPQSRLPPVSGGHGRAAGSHKRHDADVAVPSAAWTRPPRNAG